MRERIKNLPRSAYLEVAIYSVTTFWAALVALRSFGYIR